MWDVTDPTHAFRLGRPIQDGAFVLGNISLFVPGRSALITGGKNSVEALLWDVSDPVRPVLLSELRGHRVWITSAAIASDGNTLAIGDLEGKVILWDLAEFNRLHADALTFACDLTGRGLSSEEWGRYLQGVPYEETCRT